ncbi:unnamed protein product, partial [Closterium sp. NIES-53]
FYHPGSRRVLSSQDVTFDESVCFYCLHPHHSSPMPLPPLFLVPPPPPPPSIATLSPQGLAPSGVSQFDPPPLVVPLEVSSDTSGPPEGGDPAADDTAATRRSPRLATPPGFPPRQSSPPLHPVAVDYGAAGGGDTGGADSGGAGSEGAACPTGGGVVGTPAGDSGGAGGTGVGDAGAGGTGAAGAGGTGARGAGAADFGGTGVGGAGGIGAGGTGGTGAGGAGGARAGGTGATGAGGARAGGAGGTGVGGTGGNGAVLEVLELERLFFFPQPQLPLPPPDSALHQVLSLPSSTRLTPPLLCPPPDQSQPPLLPGSPLHASSPYPMQTNSLTDRRELESRPASRVRTVHRAPRLHPPPVPGTHTMALRPSVPQRVALLSTLASSLSDVPDPESDLACAASPTVTRFLATLVTDPSFESTTASTLVTELVDFVATCRLDYAASLVNDYESDCPPSVRGELALGSDVLEDRQVEMECLVAIVPHLAAMLLCPEGDPDALDIPTPRSYADAISGQYSSQWLTAMDVEMAS